LSCDSMYDDDELKLLIGEKNESISSL
jgi:hypothetical protein